MDMFQNRNPRATNLIKLGDYLGRSLRENVKLFSVDGNIATYLTEGHKVIRGQVDWDNGIHFKAISAETADIFADNKKFETVLKNKANTFIQSIYESNYSDAGLDELLELYEARVRFDSVAAKLAEECEETDQIAKILDTDEFSRLKEITPELVKFLGENAEAIVEVPEISNAVHLSNSVAKAFDIPRTTVEQLEEKGEVSYRDTHSDTIYEMIQRQELIKQEFLESKRNFETIWATNPSFNKLMASMFSEEEEYLEPLAEMIADVPYIAFASKKQLSEALSNALELDEGVTNKDIKAFASKIFEAKKPVRTYFTKMLSEKYGINLQNLKEVPTFKSLINTQVVIFEALSRLSPKGSVQRKVLSEVSQMLKDKEGVESIDVNDYIHEVFDEAGFEINENSLMNYIDYSAVADDLGKIGEILRMLKGDMGMSGGAPMAPQGQEGEMAGAKPPMPGEGAPELGQEMGEEPGVEPGMEGGQAPMPGEEEAPAMDPEQASAEVDAEMQADMGEEEVVPGEEGMEPGMEGEEEMGDGEDMEEAPVDVDQEQIATDVAEIEALIADLTDELGLTDEVDLDGDGEEEGEGEEFGEIPEEELDAEEDGGEEEEVDETDVDNDGESDMPPKKKKPKPGE